jgi:hypothetical protein
MADQFVFEHVDWSPVLFANKDFAQLMKKWNLDEFVTLKRYSRGAAAPAVAHTAPYVHCPLTITCAGSRTMRILTPHLATPPASCPNA